MSDVKKELTGVVKFWTYWVIVVALTVELFFALLDHASFNASDMEFYITHKDTLRYNFRLFSVISFILTYISSGPLIKYLYKNRSVSFVKRILWQTVIYFFILTVVTAFFIWYIAE